MQISRPNAALRQLLVLISEIQGKAFHRFGQANTKRRQSDGKATAASGDGQDYDHFRPAYVRKRTECVLQHADNSRTTRERLQPTGINWPRRLWTAMTRSRLLKWTAGLLLAPALLAVLFIAIFGWNWLRGPIERLTLDKTGRELVIGGDLKLEFGWPLPHITAGAVTFANPVWAKE
ncbi:MAG TPA: hypothetical protein VMV87_10040, partial [Burkholderiales bacterium]|nr:hypothetical protein [Burkholderiales bacterium]